MKQFSKLHVSDVNQFTAKNDTISKSQNLSQNFELEISGVFFNEISNSSVSCISLNSGNN